MNNWQLDNKDSLTLQQHIDLVVEKYRPKVIEERLENGVVVKVYEAR